MKEKFVFHYEKNYYLLKTEALKILKQFDFPIYKNGNIHFKDVCKTLCKAVFRDQKLEFKLLGEHVRNKMNKLWLKKYKILRRQQKNQFFNEEGERIKISPAIIFAGKIIFNFLIKHRNLMKQKKREKQ